ncbi:HAMP domain-containing protein [Hominisplanchenecus murintestinalis]|uniref:HAMP domain-containing protein n=1 Tax=Hominisplanchenecus murintestinalis TaxID=2941517 RepID=A0AC61QWW0_9FIRM|nr:HAMP domain-containing sensor histidine kinase [Hominisplanchenecus murintestinalis]TGX97471.1 HAMP domain-containing protein [Hominisplanchenecus murintestinalis]
MKHSIKKEMALLFIGIMLLTLIGNWAVNNIFLESYYMMKKKNTLVDAYCVINQVEEASEYESDMLLAKLNEIREANNIVNFVILDENFDEVIGLHDGTRKLERYAARLWIYIQGGDFFGMEDLEIKVLQKKDAYVLQRTKDVISNTDSLEIWGTLNTGCYFAMAIPIESIRENAKISNEFLGYFSLAALTLSVLLIWWISKKITDPILELADLSKRMANLEFDAKYTSGGKNEIGQLGEHFNQMSETLERTISELKTANNELQRDIEQKTQIDEMRKEFLSNVSHELKTPIALIQGYAEGLKECINDDDESREFYCDVIMDESKKMNTMVKKLLTLNQLEFGNDAVVMERFELTSLIRGVIQSAQILAQQKGARMIFDEPGAVYVWADEFKIEEVITNYISNAVNHVDFDKVIDVKVRKENGKVRVSVFNTGKPIPEEDLDKIWIKFYKVDKARTREYGGSGIGLSIVKAVMDSMNQECGVINYDNGVEFWFELDGGERREPGDER